MFGRRRPLALLLLAATMTQVSVAADRVVTQGRGKTTIESLFECPGATLVRPVRVGTIEAKGTSFTLPAATNFAQEPKAPDLYNECAKVVPASSRDVNLDDIPIVTIDADGEVITGYLIADNYFELYVNGTLVGVDAVPFVPFNSAVVRFRAKRPITYAVKLVDWEEDLGLGTERGRAPFHPGDGGFLARFSDGTQTDASWRAQSFYIAPLASPNDVVEKGSVHATPSLARTYPEAPDSVDCGEKCFAIHYPIPATWMARDFDDSAWPLAHEFTHAQMGAQRLRAYTNVREPFGTAKVIWSNNLVLDNVVLARKIVR